ncbi:MAG: hypothetical protein ACOYL3_05155 [Desulfuromonadaceae bacterium]
MQKKLTVLTAAVMMIVPTLGFAAMAGSNTVNSAAIVDGSIATADIANAAVTGAKIASGTITATQLATGSVTDAKITGPISVSKLPVGTSSTTVAAGNHSHSGAVKYAQVVVVAKSGGDSNNPANAVAAISDASATKPYLVRVMPGVYDIGNASVVMKPFVEMEGSGDTSVITSTAASVDDWSCDAGTINMANNSAIRNIKILNTGSVDGLKLASGVVMSNVKASAENITVITGSKTRRNERNAGVCSQGAAGFATLNNVRLETHNYDGGHSNAAMVLDDSSMTITNSKLYSTIYGNGGGGIHVLDCVDGRGGQGIGVTIVTNSHLEGFQESTDSGSAFWVSFCKKASISNSTLVMNTVSDGIIDAGGTSDLTVVNTQIFAPNSAGEPSVWWGGTGTAKFVNSRIPGGFRDTTNMKLINNYDEIYNLIANQ